MSLELAVIVLNYRTAELTLDCLASLEREVDEGVRVVVVDNASGDGSDTAIERAIAERGWARWARLLRAPANDGFAAGNNLGIRSVEAAAYVLLNSDTIVRPGAMAALRRAVRERADAGVIGAGILTAEGRPDWSIFRVLTPLSELIRAAHSGPVTRLLQSHDPLLPITESPREVGWVGFACAVVRREVVEQVGPLDDGFFMYFEDVDYCRRAAAAGWKILYWPEAKVVHLQGASSKVTHAGGRRRRAPRYFYEARARYFAKFYGRGGLWLANTCWHLGRLVSLPRELFGREPNHREREALDIWTNALQPLRGRDGATP
jgi:N-acetylglucosaminyl-diphospho-decaprenol L-rhamnosyltransferase